MAPKMNAFVSSATICQQEEKVTMSNGHMHRPKNVNKIMRHLLGLSMLYSRERKKIEIQANIKHVKANVSAK